MISECGQNAVDPSIIKNDLIKQNLTRTVLEVPKINVTHFPIISISLLLIAGIQKIENVYVGNGLYSSI